MLRRRSKLQYKKYKEQARVAVHARLSYFNSFYNHAYRRVFIKNTKSRWASCSTLGNLNFNYKIIFLPPALQDYLVVHELCHLRHFDHSPAFWALVGEALPAHRAARRALRRIERGVRIT
ncbi:M48 family peptidase [Candidatus Kaiserbacteria bacterium]|nr:M48 family peptidase [Candidatus Kaiserbacteria bacterium]